MARSQKSSLEDVILITGQSNPILAKAIGSLLGKEVHEPISVFSDGEIRVRLEPNMRRKTVFIIQTTARPVNTNIMELIFMIDAAKRASAAEVIAVVPYFGYSRQDRKEMPRVPISASVVANMLTHAGADRIVTIDIHSQQQVGFVKEPWDNLFGSYSLIPEIKKRKLSPLVIASPDKGGMVHATGYARLLGSKEIAVAYKQRDISLNNVSNVLAMIGDVKDRHVLIVDDMIDTAGTIVHAANYIKTRGAKSVRVAATHGLLSGVAMDRIRDSSIEEMIITNTINQPADVWQNKKVTIVSVAPLLAQAIQKIRTGESVSDLIL